MEQETNDTNGRSDSDQNTTPDTTDATPTQNPHDPKEISFFTRYRTVIVLVGIAVILIALGSYYISVSTTEPEPVNNGGTDIQSLLEDAAGDSEGPVATVNGEPIPRQEFENSVRELANTTSRQGFNVSDSSVASQIRQQAVAILINTHLLIQAAEAAGIEVDEAAINEQYQTILADMGSEEVLRLTLQDMGMDEADLREDIREQLIVDELLQRETDFTDVSVDDAEVEEYYSTISANNPDVPPLEEIEAELSNQLLQQKRQQVVSDYIQTLRTDAEIEVLI